MYSIIGPRRFAGACPAQRNPAHIAASRISRPSLTQVPGKAQHTEPLSIRKLCRSKERTDLLGQAGAVVCPGLFDQRLEPRVPDRGRELPGERQRPGRCVPVPQPRLPDPPVAPNSFGNIKHPG